MGSNSLKILGIISFCLEIGPAIFDTIHLFTGGMAILLGPSLALDIIKALFVYFTIPYWNSQKKIYNFKPSTVKILLYTYIFIITVASIFLATIIVLILIFFNPSRESTIVGIEFAVYALLKLVLHLIYFFEIMNKIPSNYTTILPY